MRTAANEREFSEPFYFSFSTGGAVSFTPPPAPWQEVTFGGEGSADYDESNQSFTLTAPFIRWDK